MKHVLKESNARPIKAWVSPKQSFSLNDAIATGQLGEPAPWTVPDIEAEALKQLKNLARLPFIASNGVAVMPDVHAGKGSTVGTVIATERAVIPAAVGVDIGCGMNAVRLTLTASDLPDSLAAIRSAIEAAIPVGTGQHKLTDDLRERHAFIFRGFHRVLSNLGVESVGEFDRLGDKMRAQLGTLGSGNHFIELCLDEEDRVWVMLHSGSRGIGNIIGSHFIEKAKREMERFFITLPDQDLAYLPEGSVHFDAYMESVQWAQNYAAQNRHRMMDAVLHAIGEHIGVPFSDTDEAINCHHNYVERENHFGHNLWVTRKGAVRAREGDLGIIPGSMGQQSYIVRGKGNAESYCSCSHGAGRQMSRAEAKRRFSIADLIEQTKGVECRKDAEVIDEIPGAYKRLDLVMEAQRDLVEVVHTLRAVLCVKGN